MADLLYEIRVTMDRAHQPLSVVVITDAQGPCERVRPLQPGPFDTADEAFALGRRALDEQLALW